MPWTWVLAGLVLWTFSACAVIALCMSARQIDARLGRDRKGVRYAMTVEPHPGTEAKVE